MKVFLSSTCYDLVDLRAILEQYFEKRGDQPLLSDRVNFPVDPGQHRHCGFQKLWRVFSRYSGGIFVCFQPLVKLEVTRPV